MVDVGAPPQQSDWEDIASAEGASEKNSTNFDLRIPQNVHEKPQKAPSFAPQVRKPKYPEKGPPPPPDPKKWGGGGNLTPRFHQQWVGKKALYIYMVK